MYVRDAKNREEVWLLDHIEAMGLDERAFRSRDYVVAIDEQSGEKAGFGRIRIHPGDEADVCELTSIGVLDGWRGQGVGAHIIERLVDYAGDEGLEDIYTLAPTPEYLEQFGFDRIDDAELPSVLSARLAEKRDENEEVGIAPMRIPSNEFDVPGRLRDRFKRAGKREVIEKDDEGAGTEELAEEFGIDPEEATYKYDTSGTRR